MRGATSITPMQTVACHRGQVGEDHRDTGTTGRMTMSEKGKRGFASLDPEKRRELSSKGGKAAHAQGRAPQVYFRGGEGDRKEGRRGHLGEPAAYGRDREARWRREAQGETP